MPQEPHARAAADGVAAVNGMAATDGPAVADGVAAAGRPAGARTIAAVARAGVPRRPRPTPDAVRETLRRGGDAVGAVLADADDGVLLSVLDEGVSARRGAAVVDELVARAGRRRPETADAVCAEVLRALLYVDRRVGAVKGEDGRAHASHGGSAGPERAPGPVGAEPEEDPRLGARTRIRNAVALYEGLVRPRTGRGRTCELLAVALPRLWQAPDGAGREVVHRILEGPGPAGFGESGWRALFLSAVPVMAPAVPDADASRRTDPSHRADPSQVADPATTRPRDNRARDNRARESSSREIRLRDNHPGESRAREQREQAGRGGADGGRTGRRWAWPRRSWVRGRRGGDSGRLDLQPGQLWVSMLLGVIAVALVLIVILTAA